MSKHEAILQSTPELQPYLLNANHIDIKTVEGNITMREFLAGMFSYYPSWLKSLYRVRGAFVRLLGMKQEGIPDFPKLSPDDVCMTPGEDLTFFTVETASEDFWLSSIVDTHLKANLGVVKQGIENGRYQFHIITIVHYLNWTGVVYFNVIRPFHHLVVAQMAKSAIHYTTAESLARESL